MDVVSISRPRGCLACLWGSPPGPADLHVRGRARWPEQWKLDDLAGYKDGADADLLQQDARQKLAISVGRRIGRPKPSHVRSQRTPGDGRGGRPPSQAVAAVRRPRTAVGSLTARRSADATTFQESTMQLQSGIEAICHFRHPYPAPRRESALPICQRTSASTTSRTTCRATRNSLRRRGKNKPGSGAMHEKTKPP